MPDIDPLTDLDAYIDLDPENALIELDRQIVKQGGLSAFMRLAWPIVEGAEASFINNWHISAINEHLMAVSDGEIRRLAIAVPPRHAKSLCTAVMWPAFDWIRRPWRRFLFASYAHNLSIRDSVRCRRIVQSEWYQKRWGHRFKITSDQNTKIRFDNDKNGYRLSTSVDGQLTGEGGDVIVVDDPHNVRKAESEATRENTITWWNESMMSRLNDPKTGAFVLIQQRVHQLDLMGHVLRKESAVPWTVLCLPAEFEAAHPQRWFRDPRKEEGELLWPARQGPKEIEELKEGLGPYASAGQLQQRPSPREGGIFKRKWFGTPIKVIPGDTVFVRGWDFAGTEKKMIKSDPDYTVGAKVGWSPSQKYWLITDINRFRAEPHEVEAELLRQSEKDGIATQIQLAQDPGQAGKSQIHNLMRLLGKYSAFSDTVTGDKMARALTWAGKAGVGLVKLVEGDWNEPFLEELTGFPTAAHDDQCLVAGTLIEMDDGSLRPIETISPGDWVATPIGPRRVEAAGQTGFSPVCRVEFTGDRTLEGTCGHPVMTVLGEWMPLASLSEGGSVIASRRSDNKWPFRSATTSFEKPYCSMATALTDIRTAFTKRIAAISCAPERPSREPFGSISTDQSLRAAIFITAMGILGTIASKISNASAKPSTGSNTKTLSLPSTRAKNNWSIWKIFARLPKSGMDQKKASNGTGSMPVAQDSAAGTRASRLKSKVAGPARAAVHRSNSHIRENRHVLPDATVPLSGVAMVLRRETSRIGKRSVFNLRVADAHCYFANGILVHNCDAVSSAFDRLLNNTFGIMGFMEQQLVAAGIDPAALKTPSQIAAEKAAAEDQKRKDEMKAAIRAAVDLEALARAALGG